MKKETKKIISKKVRIDPESIKRTTKAIEALFWLNFSKWTKKI